MRRHKIPSDLPFDYKGMPITRVIEIEATDYSTILEVLKAESWGVALFSLIMGLNTGFQGFIQAWSDYTSWNFDLSLCSGFEGYFKEHAIPYVKQRGTLRVCRSVLGFPPPQEIYHDLTYFVEVNKAKVEDGEIRFGDVVYKLEGDKVMVSHPCYEVFRKDGSREVTWGFIPTLKKKDEFEEAACNWPPIKLTHLRLETDTSICVQVDHSEL